MIDIAILGHGVVGSGVVEVLTSHRESILKRAQSEINIKYILDLKEFPESPFADRFTKNFDDIICDDDVKIVVEVMGGLNPAFDFVKQCLEKGKSVVTSNKELVAAKGAELLKIAKNKNVNFLFEASVGGGIPIIRPLHQCLAANDVIEIAGILNGTTNFILTKMIHEQMTFADALALAQKLGYAERDPSADIEGGDACRKICILASLAFGKHVYPEQVHTEGITKVTLSDVEYANAWGGVIKLIGRVRMLETGQIQIIVCPMIIAKESQLSNVDDVFNGILVRGDATGDVVFYGKGAGKLPTASAVVADVIDCAKHIHARKNLFWSDAVPNYVQDYLDDTTAMYVRLTAEDTVAAKAKAQELFKEIEVLSYNHAAAHEFAFVTAPMQERRIQEKLARLVKNGFGIASAIRVGNL